MPKHEFTVGVEEEYQLVDTDTGELRSKARDVLELDWSQELQTEVQQTMLEIGTRVCADSRELREEIRRLRTQVASAAAVEDLSIVAAGVHPFSKWELQRHTTSERFQRLLERFGRVLQTEHIFGMHVHVAVPEGVDRIHIQNRTRTYVPHLLALSASSPVYEGRETGYSSYRTILCQRLPHSGMPPHFEDEDEYQRFVEITLDSGVLEDRGSIYWSMRPHSTHPTLEFRATDVCPRVEDAIAIATLIRLLVIAAVRDDIQEPSLPLAPPALDALLEVNEWQAARYGLSASIADVHGDGSAMTLAASIGRLLHDLAPLAEEFDEAEALNGIRRILERGNAAQRLRERSDCANLRELVLWLSGESAIGTGMDRRGEQRRARNSPVC